MLHYDIDGKPIDLMTWGKLFHDWDYKGLAQFQDARLRISTVWLGLDHNFGFTPDRRPLIFETMIFVKEGADVAREFDEAQWRWHTKEEAKEGHDTIVHCYREGINPDAPIRTVQWKHMNQTHASRKAW